MFLYSTFPIAHRCDSAIEMATEGDISGALDILADIRWQRSLLDQASSGDESAKKAPLASKKAVRSFAEITHTLSETLQALDRVDTWVRESFTGVDLNELKTNDVGMDLYLEHVLPKSWLFSSDIAVITTQDSKTTHRSLCAKGQKRFIVLLPEDSILRDDLVSYFSADQESLVLLVSAELNPNLHDMKALAGGSLPRMSIIAMNPSEEDLRLFNKCHELLRSACIQAATRKWLPQVSTKQYLENLPKLSATHSVVSAKPVFNCANVLIVSPGPSLQHDVDLLKKNAGKFVIIAALKVVDVLLEAEIIPDFAIWQDPRDHSQFLPCHPDVCKVPLILSETCHSKFFEAPFEAHLVVNDPHFNELATSRIIHGNHPCRFMLLRSLLWLVCLPFNWGARASPVGTGFECGKRSLCRSYDYRLCGFSGKRSVILQRDRWGQATDVAKFFKLRSRV